MAFEKNIIERIKVLERDELDTTLKIRAELESKNISAIYERGIFCKYCLLMDNKGSLDLFSDGIASNWTNSIEKVTIFRQLLHRNHLIVNLKPLKNNNEFIAEYGLTVQQIRRLALEKIITLNLYAYESNKNIDFEEYTKFYGSKEEKIAYESLFIQSNNTRINSLRRKILFDHLSHENNTTYDETISASRDRLKNIITSDSIVNDLNSRGITSANSVNAAVHQLTQQYAEVKTMLMFENDEQLLNLLNEIEYGGANYMRIIATLRALRVAMSSPFSASLGGHYTMSKNSVNSINLANYHLTGASMNALNSFTFKKDEHPLSTVVKNFVYYSVSEKFKLNEVPVFANTHTFENFLSYLRDHKSLIALQSKYVDDLIENKKYYSGDSSERNLIILEKYLQSQKDLSKTYEQLLSLLSIASKTALTVALTYLAPNNSNPTSSDSIIFTTLSEAIKDGLSPILAKFLNKNKFQIMLDANEIKKMI